MNCVGTNSKTVQKQWTALISEFQNEIKVLIETELEEIAKVTNPQISWAIECFRNNKIVLHAGGGGMYGQIEIPEL